MLHDLKLTPPELNNSEQTGLIVLILVVLLLAGAVVWQLFRTARLRQQLSTQSAWSRMTQRLNLDMVPWRLVTFGLGLLFVLAALWRPQSDPVPLVTPSEGRDVMILLDISRSMNAVDRVAMENDPRFGRLEMARTALLDLVDDLESRGAGHRLALLLFAGSAQLSVPFSNDYSFMRQVLRQVQVTDLRGGTRLGNALALAERLLDDLTPEQAHYTDLLLITDGGDERSAPEMAARRIAEKGVSITTIGLGTVNGSRIPIRDEKGRVTGFVRYPSGPDKGQPVRAALDMTMLRKISAFSGGKAIEVGTGVLNLPAVFNREIASKRSQATEESEAFRYREWYQLPLAIGILFLLVSWILPARRRMPT